MANSLCTRLTQGEHRRIHAAAFSQGISVNAFVKKVVMAAVEEIENRSREKADPTDFLLVGVRNGPPGYKRRGRDFAKWLEGNASPALHKLHKELQGVDAVILRRENFKPVIAWCHKHFPKLMDRIPLRRQRLFAEGIINALNWF